MARKRHLFVEGTLSAALGGALTDTTMQSTQLALLPAVVAPDTATIILDPEGKSGTPEVVIVTAHASGASSATVTRQQETGSGGSAVRSHSINTAWVHAVTPLDWDHGNLDGLGDDDHPQYVNRTTAQNVAGLKELQAGVDVSGSPSGHTGGEVRFNTPTAGAQSAVTTSATGLARLNFDHRGANNTGDWVWRNGTDATATKAHLTSEGGFKGVAHDHLFGAGALGAVGTYINLGSLGDGGAAYIDARGTAANVGLHLRSKGSSSINFYPGAGGTLVLEATPGGTVKVSGDLQVANRSVGRGRLGTASKNTSQSGITAEADVTGLTQTLTIPAGRRIRVAVQLSVLSDALADRLCIRIKQDNVTVQRIQGQTNTRNLDFVTFTGEVELTPSAGSHTYKVTLQSVISGSMTVVGDSGADPVTNYLFVEDVGAA